MQQPHVRVGGANEPEVYDLASEPGTPPAIDLHTPAVPTAGDALYETVVGSGQLIRAAGGATGQLAVAAGGAALRNAPAALDTLTEAIRLTQQYGPTVARATMQAAGVSSEALRIIATGLARGTIATGSAVTGAVASAGSVLAAAASSHRNTDYQKAMGVQFAGRAAQGLLARHATALL